ncbi:hypothetical protein [Microbacterium terricola]|uniref:hypothetical protein n=1 Tax=Microbacterium terricola TaxID=344163 RepID=UPI0021E9AA24|nr:hypothetical protein [Microbacterium terricola]UYK40524.1 hypothetical protein OAU46_02385 [Microbacterium terricola]
MSATGQDASAWAAPSAWGAGLIQIALGAGLATSGLSWGMGLAALGAVGIAWGAMALARGRVIAPRAGVAGALGGLVALVVAMAADPGRTSVFAVTASGMLLLAAAIACGLTLRGGIHRARRTSYAAPRTRLVPLIAAAVLVAAIVTPALSATEAGRLAPSHSGHGLTETPHDH